MRWVVRVVAAAVGLFLAPSVGAQGSAASSPGELRWLVIPTRIDSADAASIEALHTTAEALRQELSVRGEKVWRADRATERFEVVGSAPAPKVSQSDIDRWVERSRAAVRYLARADYKAARRELKAAQRLADRAAEELNREAARAQQVLDTCLFMVRAYVETKNRAEARRQARECRHLVPRVEPSAFRHTPEVRELLAAVDAEMAAEAPGTLEVSSNPADCLLRINGVEFGRTPLSEIELPVGTYRMQVECEEGQRGRIHRVAVVSGENAFTFDAGLEHAVRTRPVLYLRYESTEAWAQRMRHADEVATTLGGGNVLAVSSLTKSEVRLDLRAGGYEPASTWIAVRDGSPESEDVRRAFDALFEGRSVDFTGAHPTARASWQVELSESVSAAASTSAVVESSKEPKGGASRPRDQRIAGWSLFGAGVASIGASIGLHVWRGELGDRFDAMPTNINNAQRWNDTGIGVWTMAAFGGAATSAAMPLLLPEYERPPWWGWTLGALGLGLTGYAIYEGITMTSCPEPYIANEAAARACVERGQEAGRISLTLAGAAPLLTIPLVYLIRPLRVAPSVSVTRTGGMVQIRRAF
jgi:hypothetical protein